MCVIGHLHKQEMRRAEDTTAIMASEMSAWRRGNAHTWLILTMKKPTHFLIPSA